MLVSFDDGDPTPPFLSAKWTPDVGPLQQGLQGTPRTTKGFPRPSFSTSTSFQRNRSSSRSPRPSRWLPSRQNGRRNGGSDTAWVGDLTLGEDLPQEMFAPAVDDLPHRAISRRRRRTPIRVSPVGTPFSRATIVNRRCRGSRNRRASPRAERIAVPGETVFIPRFDAPTISRSAQSPIISASPGHLRHLERLLERLRTVCALGVVERHYRVEDVVKPEAAQAQPRRRAGASVTPEAGRL